MKHCIQKMQCFISKITLMKNLILVFFGIFIAITSCNTKSDIVNNAPFLIDVNNFDKNVEMSDVFQSIKAINLELNDSSIIGKFGKYMIHDSLLFIHDKSDNSIVQFNLEGKFLSRLSRKGKGEGEYSHIEDFDINPFDSTIDIMSCVGVVYRYKFNGDYINMYCLPDTRAVHYISNYDIDKVAFYTDLEGDRLTLYSISENRIIKRFHKHPDYDIGISVTPFYRFENRLVLKDQFGACIKTLNVNKLDDLYCFDYNGKSLEPNEIPKYGADKLFQDFASQELDKIYNYWVTESRNYLINSFIHKGETFVYVFQKHENRGILIRKFSNGCKFINCPLFHNGKLYGVVSAHRLNKYFNNDAKKVFGLKCLDDVNEYSNPVLVIAELNE